MTLDVDAWLDDFFEAYYRRRPTNATFVGVPGHDHALPDLSEQGMGDTLAEMKGLLASAAGIPAPRVKAERLDMEAAAGFLKTQIWEVESGWFHRMNPALHTGEAVFSVMSLFLNAAGPVGARLDAATDRTRAVPAFLEKARAAVRSAPAQWTRRAIRECDGAIAFFAGGVDALPGAGTLEHAGLRSAADEAARAFAGHRVHLETDLLRKARTAGGCGADGLELIVRETHFLDESPDEIDAYAVSEMAEAQARLDEGVQRLGASDADAALEALGALHPSQSEYLGRYQEFWDRVRATCEAEDLLTWPEFPIRYVPRPRWAREAAPHLYFLFYRSPRAFHRPPVHEYLVTPIDPDRSPEEQARLLSANNDSVIKLNHVIHHGSVGHHVQNWHAFRAESRVGRMAAVDCASRIAMGCGGTMAEGWACYATDLMADAGLLTPLEELAEHRARARMCARAIVDVRLHQGRYSLDEAAQFYQRNAGMSPVAAERESVKNSMFPGGALMYLMGRDGIHRLKKEVARLWGDSSNRRFHDSFLSHGSLPVSLIAREMTCDP